jgi:hypothetical protein
LAANILRMPEFLVPNDVISAIITQVGVVGGGWVVDQQTGQTLVDHLC